MYGGAKPICAHPTLTFKTSASSTEGLEGLTVSCESCGAKATLKGAFDKDALQELDQKHEGKYNFHCTGRHPWKHTDVVLLTCKTEATSILSDSVNNGRYRNKYLFTTCRKFKGLEADVVILLDVDKATFEQENVLIFYVGTSRARIKLEITAILSDDDCKEILTSVLNYQGKIRRAKKDFAGALNAIGCLET